MEQPGVKAPGTPNSTPFLPLNSSARFTLFPGCPSKTTTDGMASPTLIRAIAAAALLKQRTLPSVHSRPPSRYALAPAAAAHWTAAARASSEPVRWPRTYIPVYHTPSSVAATAPPPPSDNTRRRGLERQTAAELCKRRGLSQPAWPAASTTAGGASGAELPGRWAYSHLGLGHWRSYKWAELSAAAQLLCMQGWGDGPN